MKTFTLPHTIDNNCGERLTFQAIVEENGVEKILTRGEVEPDCGPPLHVHYKQDEYLEVKSGRMGYQILGEEPKYAEVGEGALFTKGTPHRFWNAGKDQLVVEGWVSPPNTIVFFLSALYDAQKKSGSLIPEAFDGAYLVTQFKDEYDVLNIPPFVKKVIMPVTVFFGKILGKYRHFKAA